MQVINFDPAKLNCNAFMQWMNANSPGNVPGNLKANGTRTGTWRIVGSTIEIDDDNLVVPASAITDAETLQAEAAARLIEADRIQATKAMYKALDTSDPMLAMLEVLDKLNQGNQAAAQFRTWKNNLWAKYYANKAAHEAMEAPPHDIKAWAEANPSPVTFSQIRQGGQP